MNNLRVHSRISYRVKIMCSRYYDTNGTSRKFEKPIEMEGFDLSIGGLGVITKEAFIVDTTLEFTLYLEDIPYPVIAIVKWTDNNNFYYRYGLEFIGHNNMLFRHLKALSEGEDLLKII